MSVPLALIPASPLNIAMAPVIGSSAPVTTTVTLTAPTTAQLITGLNTPIPVVVPSVANYVRVTAYLPSVTVSAAATITFTVYSGATAGALTTVVQSFTFVTATGQTTAAGVYEYLIPVTAAGTTFPQAGSSIYLSIAATASTGNVVVNGAAATPASMVVEVA